MSAVDPPSVKAIGGISGLFVAGALLCLGGIWLRDSRASTAVRGEYRQAVEAYLGLDRDMARLREHYPAFIKARRAALDREAHRLNWIMLLKGQAKELGLLSMDFQIDAEEPWNPVGEPPGLLGASAMRLQLGALHEGDLFAFLAALHGYPHARLRIDECDLRMSGAKLGTDAQRVNVTADCRLRWLRLLAEEGGQR